MFYLIILLGKKFISTIYIAKVLRQVGRRLIKKHLSSGTLLNLLTAYIPFL